MRAICVMSVFPAMAFACKPNEPALGGMSLLEIYRSEALSLEEKREAIPGFAHASEKGKRKLIALRTGGGRHVRREASVAHDFSDAAGGNSLTS